MVARIATPKSASNHPTAHPTGVDTNDGSPWPNTVLTDQLIDSPECPPTSIGFAEPDDE